MAITYPLTFPTTPGFRKTRVISQINVGETGNPFNNVSQLQLWGGSERWVIDYELPPMDAATAADWKAFMLSLKGKYGTFYAYDPDRRTPRGVGTGTPLIKGASQTGETITTDGWTSSTTGIILAGDYIEIAGNLYMVLQDADSDASGNATLEIWPQLRASPADNAAITVNNPKGTFRLDGNSVFWESDHLNNVRLRFTAVEARTS